MRKINLIGKVLFVAGIFFTAQVSAQDASIPESNPVAVSISGLLRACKITEGSYDYDVHNDKNPLSKSKNTYRGLWVVGSLQGDGEESSVWGWTFKASESEVKNALSFKPIKVKVKFHAEDKVTHKATLKIRSNPDEKTTDIYCEAKF